MSKLADPYAELVDLVFADHSDVMPSGEAAIKEVKEAMILNMRRKFPDEAIVRSNLEKYKTDPSILLNEYRASKRN